MPLVDIDFNEFHVTIKDYFTGAPYISSSGLTSQDLQYASCTVHDSMYEPKNRQPSTATIALPSHIGREQYRELYANFKEGNRVEIYNFQPDCGMPYFAGYIPINGITEESGQVIINVEDSLVQGTWQHLKLVDEDDRLPSVWYKRAIKRWENVINEDFSDYGDSVNRYTVEIPPTAAGLTWTPHGPVLTAPGGDNNLSYTWQLIQTSASTSALTLSPGDEYLLEFLVSFFNDGHLAATGIGDNYAEQVDLEFGLKGPGAGLQRITFQWALNNVVSNPMPAVATTTLHISMQASDNTGAAYITYIEDTGSGDPTIASHAEGPSVTHLLTARIHVDESGTLLTTILAVDGSTTFSKTGTFDVTKTGTIYPYFQTAVSGLGQFVNLQKWRVRKLVPYLMPGKRFVPQATTALLFTPNQEEYTSFLEFLCENDGTEMRLDYTTGMDQLNIDAVGNLGINASNQLGFSDFPYKYTSYSRRVQLDNPFLYYRLNDALSSTTGVDSSVNNDTGNVNGTVTFQQAGAVTDGTGALFDGSTGYIQAANSLPALTGSSFSFELWTKIPGAVSTTQVMVNSPSASTWIGVLSPTKARLSVSGAGSLDLTGLATYIGQWIHLVGVWDQTAGTLTIYLNGNSAASSTPGGSSVAAAGNYVVGANNSHVGNFYTGSLEEVALYSYALTAQQVSDHYNNAPLAMLGISPVGAGAEIGDFSSTPPFRFEEGYNLANIPGRVARQIPHGNEILKSGSGQVNSQLQAITWAVAEQGNPAKATAPTYPIFEVLSSDNRAAEIQTVQDLAAIELASVTDTTPSFQLDVLDSPQFSGKWRAGDYAFMKTQSLLSNVEQSMRIMEVEMTSGNPIKRVIVGRGKQNSDIQGLLAKDMILSWLYDQSAQSSAVLAYPYVGSIAGSALSTSWTFPLDQYTSGVHIISAKLRWFTAAGNPVSSIQAFLNGYVYTSGGSGTDSGDVDITAKLATAQTYTLQFQNTSGSAQTLISAFVTVRIKI